MDIFFLRSDKVTRPDIRALWVFYSSIGDRPERILRARVDLGPDWREWTAVDPVEVLRPQFDWEGGPAIAELTRPSRA
jgi:hypothetical protein